MRRAAAVLVLLGLVLTSSAAADTLRIGSKRFTESYVLGEVLRQAVAGKASVQYKPGLGNTGIVFAALRAGAIDVYPEYTGTIAREILHLTGDGSLAAINRALAPMGLAAGVPLGFNDSYALAMRGERAGALGIRRISDLARHPALHFAFSQEFLGRADGWPGLRAAYGLPQMPSGIDHGLAYQALAAGSIDVTDAYSTDARIARLGLRVLEDDRGFFPRYDAVLLYRADLPQRFPAAWQALRGLEGRINADTMMRMNAAAEIDHLSFAAAAALLQPAGKQAARAGKRRFVDVLFGPDFWRLTGQHCLLVFVSLAVALAVAVPLGTLAANAPRAAQLVLGAVGIIQTIPSLALLAFLIALLGTIGTLPALVALFLYALLPIVRNTHAGLLAVGGGMRQAAMALGLARRDRLLRIELPLALPAILAGVKTSAVINVGTATIAAFIGAGGYGERIVAGLALNDNALLLAGALPAAALALILQGGFELLERWCSPLARSRGA